MAINKNRAVGDLAAEIPGAPRIFERFGIDYCCGGSRTLEDVCAAGGANLNEVIQSLEQAKQEPPQDQESVDWQTHSLSRLISHIVEKHHSYVKQELPRLKLLIDKVGSVHRQAHPELLRVQELFDALASELNHHLQKEEMILFPYVTQMEKAIEAGQPAPLPFFGTVQNPIRMMVSEHDHAGNLLREIRAASADYALPADACMSYRTLWQALRDFEADLHQHIHLENNILFPRASALEEAQPDAPRW